MFDELKVFLQHTLAGADRHDGIHRMANHVLYIPDLGHPSGDIVGLGLADIMEKCRRDE